MGPAERQDSPNFTPIPAWEENVLSLLFCVSSTPPLPQLNLLEGNTFREHVHIEISAILPLTPEQVSPAAPGDSLASP